VGDRDDKGWIATYKPDMMLYITSGAKQGQNIETISKLSDFEYRWEMDSVDVQDQSRYMLKRLGTGRYAITPNNTEK
jgi:hypothetical protein